MSSRSVFVVGATGKQGGAVADHLLSGEHGKFDVYALTRSPDGEAAQSLADRGATIISGDLQDRDSYWATVDRVDAVYCMTHFAGGYDSEVEQGTTIAEVAADVGVEQFVFSSVGGAERETGVPHFESKWEIEQRIRDLDLPATIIRPVFFMQNFEMQREMIHDGTVAFPLAEVTPVQMLDVDDIGAFAASALANPAQHPSLAKRRIA
ncbi:NmrA/HSCARG family protein [Halococcus salifodinae]|uniref:NmrA family protein n=1 Tax=Halococcus salifodinae DSM 8989 TaxID=1227456 RepID=M0N2E6_9EURY|nr:NmrA/HSCARG family protein [Halococcus salifodinae]EMA51309.1 NmrA family protein [Halococcus salifodinae DSM 8989]